MFGGVGIDAGPNHAKAPHSVMRAATAIVEAAEKEGDSFSMNSISTELTRVAAMNPFMKPPTPEEALRAKVDSLLGMEKPGQASFLDELPPLHEAFSRLGELAAQVAPMKNETATIPGIAALNLAEMSFDFSAPSFDSSLAESIKPEEVVVAARGYLEAFSALPENSALRGPFFR
jgi:hypothetical protein